MKFTIERSVLLKTLSHVQSIVEKRNTIPVVTDSNNTILWLPGVKKSKFDVESNGIYDIILSYEEE